MSAAPAVEFSSVGLGLAALALALCAMATAMARKIPLPVLSRWLFGTGLLLLALSAARPIWFRTKPGKIAVMVDLSPSTRGAQFRSGWFLKQRIGQLVGSWPYEALGFASRNRSLDLSGAIEEMPSDRTIFSPPPVDAIVLFSDAQFKVPEKSPPVYVVMDEALENVKDAAVKKVEVRGNSLAATISNTGPDRSATFPGSTAAVASGTIVITRPAPTDSTIATIKLNRGDLWPENDSISTAVLPPPASEKWWVGENPPDTDWRTFEANQLPQLKQDYLSPAVIVLANQPAGNFSPLGLERLTQYVRDLGGSLLIEGGDHSFGAGGYGGTILEQLSPLASFPPTPTTRWVLLTDASGSMAQGNGGNSPWQSATSAIVKLLPGIPPADPVQIGQFSQDVKWWLPPGTAADAASASLPPSDAYPHGPTNLEAALNQIADDSNGEIRTELILLSDCDATITHPDILMDVLAHKQIRLHVLAIGNGSALGIIHGICQGTGGEVVQEQDPQKWAQSLRTITQAALPPSVVNQPVMVRFENGAGSIPITPNALWDRTWMKPDAQWWAESDLGQPLAGFWKVGTGCVLATGFSADGSSMEALIGLIAQKPRDPRFIVKWDEGSQAHLTVDAVKNGKFLNGLRIMLEISGDLGQTQPLEQTGPGRYEATLESSRETRIASLRVADETIQRWAISGRYPPEFDALGNDHEAMRKLAEESGGDVIWPGSANPIDFHWPRVPTYLGSGICFLGLGFLAAGTVVWRLRQSSAW